MKPRLGFARHTRPPRAAGIRPASRIVSSVSARPLRLRSAARARIVVGATAPSAMRTSSQRSKLGSSVTRAATQTREISMARRRPARKGDPRQQLVRPPSRDARPGREAIEGHRPLTVGTEARHRGIERQQDGNHVRGGRGVDDVASDRRHVPDVMSPDDLRALDERAQRALEGRRALEAAMRDQRPEGDRPSTSMA
jgi:hypothetical protein